MISSLYKFLNNNPLLVQLIGQNRVFPIFTPDTSKPSLVYNAKSLKAEVSTYEILFSINIIWTNFDTILQIEKILNQLLHFADSSIFCNLDNYIFNSLNTGGTSCIYNPQDKIYEYTINYKITYKEN